MLTRRKLAQALSLPLTLAVALLAFTSLKDARAVSKEVIASPSPGGSMPQLTREGGASAGAISKVALATVDKGIVVTAVRDDGGDLKLIAWQVSGNTQGDLAGAQHILRKGDASGGAISKVALAKVGQGLVVTAVRAGSGDLKLIAWSVSNDGAQIKRTGDASAGPVSEVTIVSLDAYQFVTAVRDGGGDLKLVAWHITADGKKFVRLGEASAGAVSEVSVAPTGCFDYNYCHEDMVTAVRDGSGNLKLIAWSVSKDGLQIERKGDGSAGAISKVETAYVTRVSDPGLTNPRAVVVTAVRDGGGNLKLINWYISATFQVERKWDSSAGAISDVAVTMVGTPFATDRVITAVRDGGGNLKLIAWDDGSHQIVKEGEASASAISEIAVDSVWGNYLVTAVRDGNGNLKLIGWKHSGPS